MAEFPDLGKHCSFETCKQLDFLPLKCDACQNIFCSQHYLYSGHECLSSHKKDVQVPVCPLCSQPVPPNTRGDPPDIAVSAHIDRDCKQKPKPKVYTNRCSAKGCKGKELVPVVCDKCRLNFCFKHRHVSDHDCGGFQNTGRSVSAAGAAAVSRLQQDKKKALPKTTRPLATATNTKHVQGNMTEDEALAAALQASMNTASSSTPPLRQEDADRILAEEMQQQEYQGSPHATAGLSDSENSNQRRNRCLLT